MFRKLIAILFVILPTLVWGQLNNEALTYAHTLDKADSNSLWFGARALAFNKNNEYFNKITDGLTLFGYQFNPYLEYHAGTHFVIEAGIYLQQDFGNKNVSTIEPTFSIKYLEGNHSIIIGSLEDSYNHNLIEPLYNYEKGLIDRQEFGLQAIFDKDKLWADVWVSWETMIYRGDPKQEEVIGGISSHYILKRTEKSMITLPVQFVVYHRGGQIDTNPNRLITITNVAVGLKYQRSLSGWFREWSTEAYYAGHKNFSPGVGSFYSGSDAVYLNAGFKAKKGFEVLGSYWYGKGYYPIIGGELYSSESFSFKKSGYIEKQRGVFILRFFLNQTIKPGLRISTRFEPYYDFGNRQFEFSHGMVVSANPEFFLTRVKKIKF